MSWEEWKTRYEAKLLEVLSIPELAAPSKVIQSGWTTQNGIEVSTVSFEFDTWIVTKEEDHHGGPTGLVIGRPIKPDATKPLIFAIHGHEENHRGDIPRTFFNEGKWPLELVRHGYTVVAPSHLLYKQAQQLYKKYDYIPVWMKFLQYAVDAVDHLEGIPQFRGKGALGVSAGGYSALMLASLRSDIDFAVGAGSIATLDFFRTYLRIKDHPENWDITNLHSYTPIYLLGADKRMQWQVGKLDSWYPNSTPLPGGKRMRPTARDLLSTDVAGNFLILKKIADNVGGDMELVIHEKGHTMDVPRALEFIESDSE